ncbi:ABC transporter ATP-binding protein [Propionibacteriaceae bacterium G57]|uniref:ABC transporter ATP-binding protein n=1 Tax=Aestuariimicrobium sp. G57 TaxID=3418485 RepID=UPI003DA76FB6
MITFDHVSIWYDSPDGDGPADRAPVLDDVSFTIPEGDLCVVVGPTGVGKSTLLGAINALVPHFTGGRLDGQVLVDGRSTRDHRPRDLADVVGFVGQDPIQGFVTDTVEDEVAYGMEQLGLGHDAMRKRVEETFDLLGIGDLRRRPLTSLSGGQQQRVAIASVLAAQPRIVVLDEPTSALDPTAAQDVLSAITTLVHEVGLTVVLAEHRLERVMHAADSMLWLPGDGRAVLGSPGEVLAHSNVVPPLADLARVMDWHPVPLSVREARRRLAAEGSRRVLALNGHAHAPTPQDAADPLVSVQKLAVRRGRVQALGGVNLDFRAGEVSAVMGRNGAGKSTLMWALQGALEHRGSIDVAGTNPRTTDPAVLRRTLALVPQTAADLLYLPTVAQECAQADKESGVAAGTTAGLLDELGLVLDPSANPRDLSEGQRLGLVLAIQLAAGPRVLLLDEPTRGLDYAMKHQLVGMLGGLAARGTCVVVSTHDVEFAAAVSQRTVVLGDGEVVADGPTREVLTSSPTFAPQLSKVFFPRRVLTLADLAPQGVGTGAGQPAAEHPVAVRS